MRDSSSIGEIRLAPSSPSPKSPNNEAAGPIVHARKCDAGGSTRAYSLRTHGSLIDKILPSLSRNQAARAEVARLVTDGLTNPEVAGELGLQPKTVSAHFEHIMAKLAVGRRAEVAAWVASTRVLHSRPHGEDREE